MNKQAALHQLKVAESKRRQLQARIDELVAVLRTPDMDGKTMATWAEVAEPLGITRQSAQARYRIHSWTA